MYPLSSLTQYFPTQSLLTIPTDEGRVVCPICNRGMKEEEVSPHIDRDHGDPSKLKRTSTPVFGYVACPKLCFGNTDSLQEFGTSSCHSRESQAYRKATIPKLLHA